MPGTDRMRRQIGYKILRFGNGSIILKTGNKYAEKLQHRNRHSYFARLLYQIYFINSCRATFILTRLIHRMRGLMALLTAIGATGLCSFTTGTTIMNNRNSYPGVDDQQGKQSCKYVTKSLHVRCKDREI